jgi:phage/plasmid-like protein (TIGR03299 family)
MTHEIQRNDVFAEVRSGGKRAWHGLGTEIPDGIGAQEGFERVGLGWKTELAPIFCRSGKDSEIVVPLPGQFAHLRADNRDFLGIVGEGYKPFENQDLARFADELAGADAAVTVETAGSLYNGKRVFCLVKLPEVVKASADDVMEQYVLISNGHGGFAAFAVYPTSVRVVCANTLRWSERDIAKGIKFRHVGDQAEKLKQARTALGIARKENEVFQQQVTALVKSRLTGAALRRYMESTWAQCFGNPESEGIEDDAKSRLLAKRKDVVDAWMTNLDDERQKVGGMGGTAWAAYNAVSQWHDHERGRFLGIEESDARVASNVFGTSQKHKLTAFRGALATVR